MSESKRSPAKSSLSLKDRNYHISYWGKVRIALVISVLLIVMGAYNVINSMNSPHFNANIRISATETSTPVTMRPSTSPQTEEPEASEGKKEPKTGFIDTDLGKTLFTLNNSVKNPEEFKRILLDQQDRFNRVNKSVIDSVTGAPFPRLGEGSFNEEPSQVVPVSNDTISVSYTNSTGWKIRYVVKSDDSAWTITEINVI